MISFSNGVRFSYYHEAGTQASLYRTPCAFCASHHTNRRRRNHSSSGSRSRVRIGSEEKGRLTTAGYCVDLYCRILCGPTAGYCVDLLQDMVWTYCRIKDETAIRILCCIAVAFFCFYQICCCPHFPFYFLVRFWARFFPC